MTIKISNHKNATHNDNPEQEEEVECEESEDGDLEQEVQLVVEDEGAAGHLRVVFNINDKHPHYTSTYQA